MALQGEEFRLAQPFQVLPFPVALLQGAVVQQPLGLGDVAVPPVRVCPGDVMEVAVPLGLQLGLFSLPESRFGFCPMLFLGLFRPLRLGELLLEASIVPHAHGASDQEQESYATD
jgi:hypothetical protein